MSETKKASHFLQGERLFYKRKVTTFYYKIKRLKSSFSTSSPKYLVT